MNRIQEQFPLLKEKIHGKPVIYLDNVVTTQRSISVLKTVDDSYRHDNANPHRDVYESAMCATDVFEDARKVATNFIGVKDAAELIFTRNATEALNLIAYSYGLNFFSEGDGITISIAEYHSNLVPWQHAAGVVGASLDYLYLTDGARTSDGEIAVKITGEIKLASVAHVFSMLGVQLPVEKIVRRAHGVGAIVVLDYAQSIPYFPVDVEKLGVDFAVFPGHKMYTPLGIDALWGCRELLEEMPPFLSGGDMIDSAEEQVATYAPIPQKFEADTQDAAGAVGPAVAVKLMQKIGREKTARIKHELVTYTLERMRQIPHVATLSGDIPANERYGAIPSLVEDVYPHDVVSTLDADDVRIRAGHYCAQPLLHHLDAYATSRISSAMYNTKEDIDAFLESLKKIRGVMGYGA